MANVEKLIGQIKNGRVDPFRQDLGSLTFAEICHIYEAVTPHFGPQRHFDFKQFKRAAESIELSGVVVELGDHDGELARTALNEFPAISKWIGFDVCDADTRLEHPKYKHITLRDWFHESVTLDLVDAFVSTHTLEHLSRAVAFDTLDLVSSFQVDKMILEMPFRGRSNWNGSKSMHVFKGSPIDIFNKLEHLGWEIVYHGSVGIDHTWGAVR